MSFLSTLSVSFFSNESTNQPVVSTAAEKPLSGFNSFRFRDSTFHLLVGLLNLQGVVERG
jgi:hypothetical protein